MKRGTLALIATALVCAIAAGPEPWAKLLWRAGAPGLALPLIRNEAARGAALYELGRYDEADAAFARVGRSATYDRGLSLAATGQHALSVAYFDAVLFADRYDADAIHNRTLIDTLVDPVVGTSIGHGRIHAMLIEAGVEAAAFDPDDPTLTLLSSERDPVRASIKRPVTEERTISAGETWLDTLADAPGEYLKARLAGEMDRRIEAGENFPEEPARW